MSHNLNLAQTSALIASLEITVREYDVRKTALLGEIQALREHERALRQGGALAVSEGICCGSGGEKEFMIEDKAEVRKEEKEQATSKEHEVKGEDANEEDGKKKKKTHREGKKRRNRRQAFEEKTGVAALGDAEQPIGTLANEESALHSLSGVNNVEQSVADTTARVLAQPQNTENEESSYDSDSEDEGLQIETKDLGTSEEKLKGKKKRRQRGKKKSKKSVAVLEKGEAEAVAE
jgi:hypothetical protein